MRKELWFGFSLMALILIGVAIVLPPPSEWTNGHLGLLMLCLVVVTIMLGFPTAFTLMGMGVFFAWLAYRSGTGNADIAIDHTLTLMVQRTYAVMTNEVLIAVPLFVFMGYLVERANLIEKLFKSLHLALARLPGSLAVATLVTCAIFATATGIVGAVVTLMGLLAFPAMLRAGYNVSFSAGALTAGGCLGILIPPSVLLIVYGATAGVSVVQLYAGAFFPGIMLAGLYVAYVIILAKWKPHLAPPLSAEERVVPIPAPLARVRDTTATKKALPALLRALKGSRNDGVPTRTLVSNLIVVLVPAVVFLGLMALSYQSLITPAAVYSTEGLTEMGGGFDTGEQITGESSLDLATPPGEESNAFSAPESSASGTADVVEKSTAEVHPTAPLEAPKWFWITLAIGLFALFALYWSFNFVRLEIFKMLLSSFFPLAVMILFVLGSIVFGFATPAEAAAVGALGGILLAAAYRQLNYGVVRDSVYLTAKTSAMVCWLFVGSSIFSAAFALLGGQELVEKWVLGMDLTPIQFMILAQFIIFLLGWPLEWTEIIVIFMPIFIPLLGHFNIDPLFFGILVALNLQTAFLSPPVAMAAFYLKGVAPPHVTLNQIFLGMLPYMAIQIFAMVLLYIFPQVALWLPYVLYD